MCIYSCTHIHIWHKHIEYVEQLLYDQMSSHILILLINTTTLIENIITSIFQRTKLRKVICQSPQSLSYLWIYKDSRTCLASLSHLWELGELGPILSSSVSLGRPRTLSVHNMYLHKPMCLIWYWKDQKGNDYLKCSLYEWHLSSILTWKYNSRPIHYRY